MFRFKSISISILIISLISNSAFAALQVKRVNTFPEYLRVENFISLTASEFEGFTGHKMNWIQKLYFKKLKNRLKKSEFNHETTILDYYNIETGRFKLNPLWFVLGCIIGPFAVLFSFTTRNQTKNKHISALIGLGVFVLWFGFIFLF